MRKTVLAYRRAARVPDSSLIQSFGSHMSPGKNVTKEELIIDVWERLDCESVGTRELTAIQQSLRNRFGESAVDSPARIARLVADEGAVLKHPEVLDCDADWRERDLSRALVSEGVNFDDLDQAAAGIRALDEVRLELEAESRHPELARLREAVLGIRKDRQLVARSKVGEERARREAGEIAEWLAVWLNTPGIFADWLELRRRSPAFLERFGQ